MILFYLSFEVISSIYPLAFAVSGYLLDDLRSSESVVRVLLGPRLIEYCTLSTSLSHGMSSSIAIPIASENNSLLPIKSWHPQPSQLV